MEFKYTEDQIALRRAVREWAQSYLAPKAEEIDVNNRFPTETIKALGEQDLMGLAYVVCLVGSFATSCVTTVCLWLDSLIYDYYSFAFVFGSALIRFGKDIVIVAIVTTIVIPLMKLLRRGGLVPVLN